MVELPLPLCTQVWLTVWSLVASPVQLFFAIAAYRPQVWPTVWRLVARLSFSRRAGKLRPSGTVQLTSERFHMPTRATILQRRIPG
jgi:hypothetical protein